MPDDPPGKDGVNDADDVSYHFILHLRTGYYSTNVFASRLPGI